jgi:hypothetical protein
MLCNSYMPWVFESEKGGGELSVAITPALVPNSIPAKGRKAKRGKVPPVWWGS